MTIEPNMLASVVVDELVRNGVTRFVYCPGSRNGPIGFALNRRAQQNDLELHVRLDERSAAYLALGLGKADGAPAAIVTTSGTAVANALPAVCEANYGHVPLVVLSANRPPEALGTGASQTVEQFAFFDGQVRHKVQAGSMQRHDDAANADVRSHLSIAALSALGRLGQTPGPVQVDLPLTSGRPPSKTDPPAPEGRADGHPWIAGPPPQAADHSVTTIELSTPTLVVAGDGADARDVPAGVPMVAEPTVDVGERPRLHPWSLDTLNPHQVVVLGKPTLFREVSTLLERDDVAVFVQSGTVPRGVFAAPHASRVSARYRFGGTCPPDWLREADEADRIVRDCWADCLDLTSTTPTGLHVARQVLSAVQPGTRLWVGASNPIRDLALAGDILPGVPIHANRGVAGIDGTISSAIGLALAEPHRQVVALVGDLTFQHDASSLQFGQLERRPENLVVIVANDHGGGIFETLEQGDSAFKGTEFGGAFERVYGTPQHVDIESLCQAYGVQYRNGGDGQWMIDLNRRRGLEVIEIPTTRESLRGIHAEARHRLNAPDDHQTPRREHALRT